MAPSGSGGLGPWASNKQLGISSSPGSSYCNEICSMGFALEHQIKFTSGVGVNGGGVASACSLPESQEACRSKGFPLIQPPLGAWQVPSRQDRTQLKTGELGAVTPHGNRLSGPHSAVGEGERCTHANTTSKWQSWDLNRGLPDL